MDNVGDWIYIVFLIVAAISGLFSSKNKKKRPTQVLGQPGHDSYPEENTSSGKGFWEILEEATTPQKPEAPTAPTRSLSQLITSFIASESQGIRHAPLLTFFQTFYSRIGIDCGIASGCQYCILEHVRFDIYF